VGLKLTVSKGDKILIGDAVVLDVKSTTGKQTQLEFFAPKDIKINTVFLDSSKQFKNRQKEGGNL
jgi:sRNA-binding carbon storage regulator CsrA